MFAALVFAVGLAAMAYQVYELNTFRLQLRDLGAGQALESVSPAKGETPGFQLLALLSKQHLMGQPYHKPVGSAPQASVIDTALKLELLGVMRGERDSALIQAKGKEAKRYYVGEQVENGAVLDAVKEDSVVLKRGAALEILKYSANAGGNTDAQAPVPQPANLPTAGNPPGGMGQKQNVAPGQQQQKPNLRDRLRNRNKPVMQQTN